MGIVGGLVVDVCHINCHGLFVGVNGLARGACFKAIKVKVRFRNLHPMYIVPIRARMAMASAVLAINVVLLNHEMVDNLLIHPVAWI
jgi:hypothetical protein